jgi:hypothetical protein
MRVTAFAWGYETSPWGLGFKLSTRKSKNCRVLDISGRKTEKSGRILSSRDDFKRHGLAGKSTSQ